MDRPGISRGGDFQPPYWGKLPRSQGKMPQSRGWALLVAAALLLAGCQGDAEPQPSPGGESRGRKSAEVQPTLIRFQSVAVSAGVTLIPRNGQEAGHCSILESLGTGVALLDYDNDGDLDLFFVGGGRLTADKRLQGVRPALYENQGNWRFVEVTDAAGVAEAPFYAHAAVSADYDNDGDPDLLITGYGGLLLYQNQGNGTFREVSREAGLINDLWSSAAAWGDFDQDGRLDLYLVNYVDWSFDNHRFCGRDANHRDVCPPGDFAAQSDRLFLAQPDGTFRDASRDAGLKEGGKGLGVVTVDLDGDGDLDIYVANDTTPNFLYRNNGQAVFEEIGIVSGAALNEFGEADGSMGVDAGDFDRDGKPDLWVANFENQSFALYRNLGNCIFQHQSKSQGISATRGIYVGFGTVMADADRDGDLDIFAANGHVMYHSQNSPYRQTPLLFENRQGRFTNVGEQAGDYFTTPHVGRGAAAGDLDNDGRPDLVVTHTNEPVALLRNVSRDDNNWLQIHLTGNAANRDAVGAQVTVRTRLGAQTRQVKAGNSYLSSGDKRLFFGLGKARTVDEIEIWWPGGRRERHAELEVNRRLEFVQPRPSPATPDPR